MEHIEKRSIIAVAIFVVFALIVLAFVPPPASMLTEDAGIDTSLLIGTYEGITPCADCPGIRTELTLVKDSEFSAEGTYRMSMTYLERDVEPYVTAGIWTTERGTPSDPDATVFALDPDKPNQTQRYLKVDATTIRQLDREGNEIDSSLPFDLTLTSALPSHPVPSKVTLRGTQICLPHKDTTGPQTLECALGMKADDGKNYALDLAALGTDATPALTGQGRLEISGTLTPIELLSSDHYQKYDVAGILSATSLTEI